MVILLLELLLMTILSSSHRLLSSVDNRLPWDPQGNYGRLHAYNNIVYFIFDFRYIYVPTACASGKTSCHLHVSFHGCKQDLDTIGNVYADKTGLNDWAENNNIIILYPYAEVSNYNPSNPNG